MPIKIFALIAITTICAPLTPAAAQPSVVGGGPACTPSAPGIQVDVTGLKDRSGQLRLEVYPANQADFLKDDEALLKEGKLFRRRIAPVPAAGPALLCVAVPQPGAYAIIVIHDRDNGRKFSISRDGIGVPGNTRLGRTRPTVAQATVVVGNAVATTVTKLQYLRGLSGFGPLEP
ncbi:DUF2141 domain-containing protein [Sphingomonas sp. ASY06-1R]|uniref:DUF2141 domain-containing protein n=1 Tax=Sphingomonas sp. ASY06-1R TaxID=3445771 RepID=UPI003FA22E76